MINLNVEFTEQEYRRMKKAKIKAKCSSWHQFIVTRCCKKVSVYKEYQNGTRR